MYKSLLVLAAVASASAFVPAPRPVARTALSAEDVDYEAQFGKLQKEAEERLDEKVEELMKNIETVGQD
ncbi:hypothetical protein ACHAWF_010035 [Thalassiosira exigua]